MSRGWVGVIPSSVLYLVYGVLRTFRTYCTGYLQYLNSLTHSPLGGEPRAIQPCCWGSWKSVWFQLWFRFRIWFWLWDDLVILFVVVYWVICLLFLRFFSVKYTRYAGFYMLLYMYVYTDRPCIYTFYTLYYSLCTLYLSLLSTPTGSTVVLFNRQKDGWGREGEAKYTTTTTNYPIMRISIVFYFIGRAWVSSVVYG